MTAAPDRPEKAAAARNRAEPAVRDLSPVLPTQTRDDTDSGWGERDRSNDDRLHEDRPPHWGSD